MPNRLIDYACQWWLVHAALILLGDAGFVAVLFFGLSHGRGDPGNPLLVASVGVIFLGAATTLFAAALLFGLGLHSLDRRALAGPSVELPPMPGGRPRSTVAAVLVWTYGVFGATGITAFFGLPLLGVPILIDAFVPFSVLWAIGAAAFTAGSVFGRRSLESAMTGRDSRPVETRILLYAALNLAGASMLAVGFLGKLLDPVLLLAVVGAVLLFVVGPIVGIAAFRRLRRELGPPGPTTKPT